MVKALRYSLYGLGVLGFLILGLGVLLFLPPVQKSLFIRYLEADGIMQAEVDGFRLGWSTVTIDNLRLERRNDRYGTDRVNLSISLWDLLRGRGLTIHEADLGNVYFFYHERDPDEERIKRERPFQGILEELREVQRMETPEDEPAFVIRVGQLRGNMEWAYYPLDAPPQRGEVSLSLNNYEPGEVAELHFNGWYQSDLLPFTFARTPFSGELQTHLSRNGIWEMAQLQGEIVTRPSRRLEDSLPIKVEGSWGPTPKGEETLISARASHGEFTAFALEHRLTWENANSQWTGQGHLRLGAGLLNYLGQEVDFQEPVGDMALDWSSDEEWELLSTRLQVETNVKLFEAFADQLSGWSPFRSFAEMDLSLDLKQQIWKLNQARLDIREIPAERRILSLVTPYPLQGTLADPWSNVRFQDTGSGPLAELRVEEAPLKALGRALPQLPLEIGEGVLGAHLILREAGWLVQDLSLQDMVLWDRAKGEFPKPTSERKLEADVRGDQTVELPDQPFQGILSLIVWPEWLEIAQGQANGIYFPQGDMEAGQSLEFSLKGESLGRQQSSPLSADFLFSNGPGEFWRLNLNGQSTIRPDGNWQNVIFTTEIIPPEQLALPESTIEGRLNRTSTGETYFISWTGKTPPHLNDSLEITGQWKETGNSEIVFDLNGQMSLPRDLLSQNWIPKEGNLVTSGSVHWDTLSAQARGDLALELTFPGSEAPNLSAETNISWDGDEIQLHSPSIFLVSGEPLAKLISNRTFSWSAARGWSGWRNGSEEPIATLESPDLLLTQLNPFLQNTGWKWSEGNLDASIHLYAHNGTLTLIPPEPIRLQNAALLSGGQPFMNVERTLLDWQSLTFNGQTIALQDLTLEAFHHSQRLLRFSLKGHSDDLPAGKGSLESEGLLDLPGWLRQPGWQDYHNARRGTLEWRGEVTNNKDLQGTLNLALKNAEVLSTQRRLPDLSFGLNIETAPEDTSIFLLRAPLTLGAGDTAEKIHSLLEFSEGNPLLGFTAQTEASILTLPRWLEFRELFRAPPARVITGPSGRPINQPVAPTSPPTQEISPRQPSPFWGEARGHWSVEVKHLQVDETVRLETLMSTFQLEEEQVRQSLSFQLGGGQWTSDSLIAAADGGDRLYDWQSTLRFTDFQPAGLLNPTAPTRAVLTGTFSGEGVFGAEGKTLEELFSSWQGQMAINGHSGRIRALSADDRAERYAGLAGDIAGLLGEIGRRPELSAISDLTRFFSDFAFEEMAIRVERDHTLDTSLPVFRLQSPEFLVAGTGMMPHRQGIDYLDQPFIAELRIGAQGNLARTMETLRLLEEEPSVNGFRLMNRTIPLQGTPRRPDLQSLTDFILQTSLEATGLRRRSAPEDRERSGQQGDLRELLPRIFR